jgi:hypothetical protein
MKNSENLPMKKQIIQFKNGPIIWINISEKKKDRAGGVVQVLKQAWGPEFKPQYCQEEEERRRRRRRKKRAMINSHQGNANRSYNEMISHPVTMTIIKKTKNSKY